MLSFNNNDEINFEPRIIESYDNNNNNQPQYINSIPIKHNKYNSNNTIKRFLHKILLITNLEDHIIKTLGLDVLFIPILFIIKKTIISLYPSLNRLIFKEKTASLIFNYTHFSSQYFNNVSNDDFIKYRAIFTHVSLKKKNIKGCIFTTNANGNLMFFGDFDPIQIDEHIWLSSKNIENNTSVQYSLEIISYKYNIKKINKFISKCLKKYKKHNNEESNNRIIRYFNYIGRQNNNQCIFEEFPFPLTKKFDNIFFSQKDFFIERINYFQKHEATYKILGIPWCLGIMLYGKPGVVKTSLIKSIAEYTKRSIVNISLGRLRTFKELSDVIYGKKTNGMEIDFRNKIHCFEEFDLICNKMLDRKLKKEDIDKLNLKEITKKKNNNDDHDHEKNIDYNCKFKNIYDCEEDGITLDNMLLLLDGCVETHGIINIFTTNYIDIIDKALIRPGRIDMCVHLDNADHKIIIEMINHFASHNNNISKNVLTKEHKDKIYKFSKCNDQNVFSPAKISQICISNMNSKEYFDNVVDQIELEYDEQCKLL